MKVFRREEDLVDAFYGNSQKFLKKVSKRSVSRHFVIREFDSYTGVADLIMGTYRPYLSKKSCRKPVNLNWINPLVNLNQDQIITVQGLKDKYHLSEKSASLRIKEYSKAGFLTPIEKHKYLVAKRYEFVTDLVIAIEAKLKNWKRALFQARRYKKISDITFVLLDESFASSAILNLKEFENHNIGLATMSCTMFTIHHLPQVQNVKRRSYFARLNEVAYNYFTENFSTS